MLARRDARSEAARVRRVSPLPAVADQSRAWGRCCHSCTCREGRAPSWSTAWPSRWLCGLPEDIRPLSINVSYGNANAILPQCPRECTPGAARRATSGTRWRTLPSLACGAARGHRLAGVDALLLRGRQRLRGAAALDRVGRTGSGRTYRCSVGGRIANALACRSAREGTPLPYARHPRSHAQWRRRGGGAAAYPTA